MIRGRLYVEGMVSWVIAVCNSSGYGVVLNECEGLGGDISISLVRGTLVVVVVVDSEAVTDRTRPNLYMIRDRPLV